MYVQWPETLDISYGDKVKLTTDVEVEVFDVMCFPFLTKDDKDAFIIKYLVEFPNRERKWVAMSDIEVINERQTTSE